MKSLGPFSVTGELIVFFSQVPGVEVAGLEYPHDKGEVGGGHHQHRSKRSLEVLLNKLDFKAKKLELKRQKLIKHYALKGYFLQG